LTTRNELVDTKTEQNTAAWYTFAQSAYNSFTVFSPGSDCEGITEHTVKQQQQHVVFWDSDFLNSEELRIFAKQNLSTWKALQESHAYRVVKCISAHCIQLCIGSWTVIP